MNNSIYKSPEGEREVMAMYDAMLTDWPGKHETSYLPTRYGKTFLIAGGKPSNPPLILLHGASANALSWAGDFPIFNQNHRVYAVDIPGDPGRSVPRRLDWNSPQYAEWMEDLLHELKIERVSLVGLSQGGWNALKFSIYQPQRVEKLALLTPSGIVPAKTSFLWRAIVYSMMGKWGADAISRIVMGDVPIDPLAVKYMEVIMRNYKSNISKLDLFTDAELRRLTMPVLFVGGILDNLQDVVKAEKRLKQLAPNVTSIMYPDKGHVLVGLAKEIVPFLS